MRLFLIFVIFSILEHFKIKPISEDIFTTGAVIFGVLIAVWQDIKEVFNA